MNYGRFTEKCEGLDLVKQNEEMFLMRFSLSFLYITVSIFLTPFCDRFFSFYLFNSACFAMDMLLITNKDDSVSYTLLIPVYWILMFLSTYFIRRVLTQFFVMQSQAAKTRDALTHVLDNLPDGVLMFEKSQLIYCNQQADSFYRTDLS